MKESLFTVRQKRRLLCILLLDSDTEHLVPKILELKHKQTSKWNIAWIQKVLDFGKSSSQNLIWSPHGGRAGTIAQLAQSQLGHDILPDILWHEVLE